MKTSKWFGLNINTALKIVTLLGFSCFFMFTIFTGSVNRYVHPRIIPYMIFAAVAMLIIAFLMLSELFKLQKGKSNSLALLFYIIPLVMAFALPAQSFDSSTRTVGDVQLTGKGSVNSNTNSSRVDQQGSNSENDITGSTTISESNVTANESSNDSSKNDVITSTTTTKSNAAIGEPSNDTTVSQNDVLKMVGDNFYNCMNTIYNDLDTYIGRKIEVVGFVFNDYEEFADNEFVPARLMMVCCAADMEPTGFLCRFNNASELEADSWVKVTGIVGKTEFCGETIPYIEAQSVVKTDKPADEYVYPY